MGIKDSLCAAPEPGPISRLFQLPSELDDGIWTYLANADIKNLRLTCSHARDWVPLRFSRVFLSTNPIDVQVFRQVADHPTLRLQVREIIYDDARFGDVENWRHLSYERDDISVSSSDDDTMLPGFARQFRRMQRCNRSIMRERLGIDEPSLSQHLRRSKIAAQELPRHLAIDIYRSFAEGQAQILAVDADMDALRLGLAQFPSLQRITVTPATHGYLYTPLYHTPMIRAIPDGLNYPIPRSWPYSGHDHPAPWTESAGASDAQMRDNERRWRGVISVLDVVADSIRDGLIPTLPELVMDVHDFETGVNPYMVTQESNEYKNLASIFRSPGFRRLDLPLMISTLAERSWTPLVNGCLQSLLAEAEGLEHLRLRTDKEIWHVPRWVHMPLCKILPLKRWTGLRHFGLSGLPVQTEDVVCTLAALPLTLRSVELSFLRFGGMEGNMQMLLDAMHARLEWRQRAPSARPKVTVGVEYNRSGLSPGRGVWYSTEVYEFLYCGGRNPLRKPMTFEGWSLGVVKDEFEPEYERPHTSDARLVELGIQSFAMYD